MRRPKRTATHWGVYEVDPSAEDLELRPATADPHPARLSDPLSAQRSSSTRVTEPAVRQGYLRDGPKRGCNRRGNEPFVQVTWDEALDVASAALRRVREQYGNEAIYAGSYGWASAGRFHHAQSQVHRFLRTFGGYTDSVNSYSYAAGEVLIPHILGQSIDEHFATLPTWHQLAEHTELVLAFGGLSRRNTQVNSGGVGRHLTEGGQRACRDAGVEFVSISPVRDDSAGTLQARWLAPRPGTDAAIMLAMAHTVLTGGLHDTAFLHRCCVGFPTLRRYLEGEADGIAKSAEWASEISDIPAETIRQLALEVARRRSFITVAWSLQRGQHGEQPMWAALALAAISGQIGRLGGGWAFGYSIEQNGASLGRSRVAALPQPPNPVTSAIPVARVADLLLEPGAKIDYDGREITFPKIELVYWCGGNPFHHHQDLNRLRRAWQQPETVIVHEPYWNALAKHADVLLPCTTTTEREDFAAGSGDVDLTAMHRLWDPPHAARDDYEIFRVLSRRLGFEDDFTEGRSAREWVEVLYERTRVFARDLGSELPSFGEFWAAGGARLPSPPQRRWPLVGFRDDPDLHPLGTPSGKIELFSEKIASFQYEDCPGHPVWLTPTEWLGSKTAQRYPLHLISNQPRNRLHSQDDQGPASQQTKIRGREPLRIHPAAAAARSIADGDIVRVYNDRGACLAGARLSDALLSTVVQLSTGAWYDPVEPGDPASLELHGNPNVLTLDTGTSRLAQGSTAQSALVEVERYDGTVPPLSAYEPPTILDTVQ